MTLRTHGLNLAFEKDDDLIYIPVEKQKAGDILLEAEQMHKKCQISYYCQDDNFDLSGFDGQLFIWGHGNKGLRKIGTSIGNNLSHNIAKDLTRKKLPNGNPNGGPTKIILWSCWAGSPGGLAESLWLSFQGTKVRNVTVYGPNYATGTLCRFEDDHRYLRGLEIYGADEHNGAGNLDTVVTHNKWIGAKTYARPAHMRAVSSRIGLKSAEW